MPNQQKPIYYWCDKKECRIPIRNLDDEQRPDCDCYRKSDMQYWCAMGRIPDECNVQLSLLRNETPVPSQEDFWKQQRESVEHARGQIQGAVDYLNSKGFREARQKVLDFHASIRK